MALTACYLPGPCAGLLNITEADSKGNRKETFVDMLTHTGLGTTHMGVVHCQDYFEAAGRL